MQKSIEDSGNVSKLFGDLTNAADELGADKEVQETLKVYKKSWSFLAYTLTGITATMCVVGTIGYSIYGKNFQQSLGKYGKGLNLNLSF